MRRVMINYHGCMAVDLFAGIPVNDYQAALAWYEKLFGSSPTFVPHDTEAVWDLDEHRSVFIVQRPEHAGTPCTPSSSTTSMHSLPRSPIGESSPRSGRPTPTVCARLRITIPTGTRSGSAAPQSDQNSPP